MKLRYDPYRIFMTSKTPVGLYARQKWIGQADTRQWKTDFDEAVAILYSDQADDGSWHQSDVETISRLFGLHLTVRDTSPKIDAALNRLLEKLSFQTLDASSGVDMDMGDERIEGLPFINCHRDIFLTAATLFLSSIFGRDDDPSVVECYRWLSVEGAKNSGLWFGRACSHNIFRAMVVHPEFSKDSAMVLAAESLAEIQSESGEWGEDLPFYQTLNALAHLHIPIAEQQLDKAFARLIKTQKPDGSWGESDSEWNTFLSIHALRNKGLI